MKRTDFTTISNGNGIPCNGDLIETKVDGINYRAEFYLDDNNGCPLAMLAADSAIEKFENGEWVPVVFTTDEEFNELLEKITPVVEK